MTGSVELTSNENYIFLRFYFPLLDCDDCRSFELNLIIIYPVTSFRGAWLMAPGNRTPPLNSATKKFSLSSLVNTF